MAASKAIALLTFALSTAACASQTSSSVVENKVQTMRAEQSPDKLVARGKAFASVGDYTRAEQYLAAALEAGAPEGEVLPMLLRVCIADKRYRAAIAYAEDHERKRPGDLAMRYLIGTLYAAVGDLPAARARFEAVLAEKADAAEAHFALAVLLRDSKADLLAMDRHFREYLRIEPHGAHAEEARAALLKQVPQADGAGSDKNEAPAP